MIVRKKLVKWIPIVLFVVSLGLLGLTASSGNTVHGQSKQAASTARNPTPMPAQASKTVSVTDGYQTDFYTDVYGAKMTYYLFVPDNYNPQQKYPLVLMLEGGGERANPKATPEQNRTVLLRQYYAQVWVSSDVQEKWPSFVLIPQIVAPGRWVNVPASTGSYTMAPQPSTSLRMAKEILDMLQHEYQGIDPDRLYVTGLSMGGYGTWEAIERWPNYFAAAAPLSGAGDPSKAALLIHEPIWAFHGIHDTVVPVSGSRDMIEAIIGAGGEPRYTEYPHGGHDLWASGKVYSPTADAAFFVWLFCEKRS